MLRVSWSLSGFIQLIIYSWKLWRRKSRTQFRYWPVYTRLVFNQFWFKFNAFTFNWFQFRWCVWLLLFCCFTKQQRNVRRKKICNHYFIIIDARWRCFCLAFFFSFCLNDFDLNIMYYDACLVFFLSSAICSEYIIKLWSEMKMFDGLSFNLRWRWNYLALFAFLYCIFLRKSIQKSHSKLLFLNHIVI